MVKLEKIVLWPYFVALIIAMFACIGFSASIKCVCDMIDVKAQKGASAEAKVESQLEEGGCNVTDNFVYRFEWSDTCFKVACAQGVSAGNPAESVNHPFLITAVPCSKAGQANTITIPNDPASDISSLK